MPLKTSLLSALFALALAGGAQAAAATAAKAEAGTSDEVDCSREQTSTVGMRICASRDLERAEQELKATRQKLRKASDPGTRKALDALFKASDTYTDALCEAKTKSGEGGTLHGVALGMCLAGETRRQNQELLDLLNRPEGS